MKLKIFIDGGARGNPGPAGAGVVIYDENGKLVKKFFEFLGKETNNQAEYHALILALGWAQKLDAKYASSGVEGYTSSEVEKLEIYSDSELLVKQMCGEYKVKNPNIKPLYVAAKFLLKFFDSVKFFHIPREKNKEADKLVNMTINEFE